MSVKETIRDRTIPNRRELREEQRDDETLIREALRAISATEASRQEGYE